LAILELLVYFPLHKCSLGEHNNLFQKQNFEL